jgi:hypothetical protein
MFEQAVQASQAMQLTAQQGQGMLIPALSSCRACQTAQMIAAPVLGRCKHCGGELTVLSSAEPQGGTLKAPGAVAA